MCPSCARDSLYDTRASARTTERNDRSLRRRVTIGKRASDFRGPPVIRAFDLAGARAARFVPGHKRKSDNDGTTGISIDRALRLASSYGPVWSNSSNRTGRG